MVETNLPYSNFFRLTQFFNRLGKLLLVFFVVVVSISEIVISCPDGSIHIYSVLLIHSDHHRHHHH